MKKFTCLSLLLVLSLLLGSCGLYAAIKEQPEETLLTEVDPPAMQIGNPWQDYESLAEAMETAGYPYELPEVIAECKAEVFRVMNGELLEVRYILGDATLTLRWSAEEDADISGVYADFTETTIADYADGSTSHFRAEDGAELILFHFTGRGSWSLYAPAGFPEGVAAVFTEVILERI